MLEKKRIALSFLGNDRIVCLELNPYVQPSFFNLDRSTGTFQLVEPSIRSEVTSNKYLALPSHDHAELIVLLNFSDYLLLKIPSKQFPDLLFKEAIMCAVGSQLRIDPELLVIEIFSTFQGNDFLDSDFLFVAVMKKSYLSLIKGSLFKSKFFSETNQVRVLIPEIILQRFFYGGSQGEEFFSVNTDCIVLCYYWQLRSGKLLVFHKSGLIERRDLPVIVSLDMYSDDFFISLALIRKQLTQTIKNQYPENKIISYCYHEGITDTTGLQMLLGRELNISIFSLEEIWAMTIPSNSEIFNPAEKSAPLDTKPWFLLIAALFSAPFLKGVKFNFIRERSNPGWGKVKIFLLFILFILFVGQLSFLFYQFSFIFSLRGQVSKLEKINKTLGPHSNNSHHPFLEKKYFPLTVGFNKLLLSLMRYPFPSIWLDHIVLDNDSLSPNNTTKFSLEGKSSSSQSVEELANYVKNLLPGIGDHLKQVNIKYIPIVSTDSNSFDAIFSKKSPDEEVKKGGDNILSFSISNSSS